MNWSKKWSEFNFPLSWSGKTFWRIYCPADRAVELSNDLRLFGCMNAGVFWPPGNRKQGHYVYFRCQPSQLAVVAACFPLDGMRSMIRFETAIRTRTYTLEKSCKTLGRTT